MGTMNSYAYEIDLENQDSPAVKIIRMVGENKRVLELGMASGHMSRVLKERCGCTVVGVEIDAAWAEEGRPHCERVIVGDIEQLDLAETFGTERFDVILCADVLEHLRDPWSLLSKLRNYLEPAGEVVISVPNAGFHGLVGELHAGKFSYREKGLLDATHLRFFTRHELELLVLSSGLVPDARTETLLGAEHSEFSASWETLAPQTRHRLRSAKDGEVYQLVVRARLPDKASWDYYLGEWEEREGGSKLLAELEQLRETLAAKEVLIQERDLVIQERDLVIRERERVIQEQMRTLVEKEAKQDRERTAFEGYVRRQWANLAGQLGRLVEQGRQLEQARAVAGDLQHRLALKEGECGQFAITASRLENSLGSLYSSRSWRVTAPLRALIRFVRGAVPEEQEESLPVTSASPAPVSVPPVPVPSEAILSAEYRDYLACFRPCDDLTDEVRWAMRAQIDAMQYQPRIAVRFSLLGLDDATFQRALDAVRYQLYPRWELWVVDGEHASQSQLEAVREKMEDDDRIRLNLERFGGLDEMISRELEIEGDYLVVLDARNIPAELTFYRLAFYLVKNNPDIAERIKGGSQPATYARWLRLFGEANAGKVRALKAACLDFPLRPLISIVMPVYNTPEPWLRCALDSVLRQHYEHWELCIADDCSTAPHVQAVLAEYCASDARIRMVRHETNQHISAASNSALLLASGDYVALFDHDDELSADALLWVVHEINRHPDAALIYSDEDKISDEDERQDPYFKPDWNPDLFLSQNFICHLAVYRADVLRAIGGFRLGFEGSQDYDLGLRFIERIELRQIRHIPRVLYHWRIIPGSTAQDGAAKPYAQQAGIRALEEHLARRGIAADVSESGEAAGNYRVRYVLPQEKPLVTLIILTRNGLSLLRQCVESIIAKTTYAPYEILIVDNGSDDPATLDYLAQLQAQNLARVLRDDAPFNFPALNNRAVKEAKGSLVGLLNNDVEVIAPDWLGEMVSHALRPEIGAVGARLWYPDNTLQHGGVILVGGVAGHAHKRLPRGHMGYSRRAVLIQDFSAVTAACLLLRKEVYLDAGGMDEQLAVAFNDVDFCLKIQAAGYRNLWTPYAELYHHESATRGYEDTPEKQARFEGEIQMMKQRWGTLLDNDPAYNPNLTLGREDFSMAFPPRYID